MSSKESKRQEKQIAKALEGGRVQVASGCFPGIPNDVKSDNWLCEAKYTNKKSYSIKRSDWETLSKNAIMEGRLPIFLVDFRPAGGEVLVIIRYSEFLELDKYLTKGE